VVSSQDLLSSIYKRAFEAECQKLIQSKSTKLVQAEIKITTGFNRQIFALKNQTMGEIFKTDQFSNSLLYKNGILRSWITKYAEKLGQSSTDVAAKISGMSLEKFQNALGNKNDLGEVLSGKKGKRLDQAKEFFGGLQDLRMRVAAGLAKVQDGSMTWGDFTNDINPRFEPSSESVDKSAKLGTKDAMNSLADLINEARGPLKNTLLKELQSLRELIVQSPYSPSKLGDLSVAYSNAEDSRQRYDENLRSPYDPKPVGSEQHISEMNVAEGNLHPDILKYA
jgi:hypothetical protein